VTKGNLEPKVVLSCVRCTLKENNGGLVIIDNFWKNNSVFVHPAQCSVDNCHILLAFKLFGGLRNKLVKKKLKLVYTTEVYSAFRAL